MPKILDSMPMPEVDVSAQPVPTDSFEDQTSPVIVNRAPAQAAPNGADVQPEEENKYAHLFASWDLVPPQVVVRRVRRIL